MELWALMQTNSYWITMKKQCPVDSEAHQATWRTTGQDRSSDL